MTLPDCMMPDGAEPCKGYLELQSKLDVAVSALRRHGYRESCNIPACNCGDQWSHGGHAAERLRELIDKAIAAYRAQLTGKEISNG